MQQDTDESKPTWNRLCPPFSVASTSKQLLIAYAKKLRPLDTESDESARLRLDAISADFLSAAASWPPEDELLLRAASLVLKDLVARGWRVRLRRGDVEVHPPAQILDDPKAEKARVRRQEFISRDEQLSQPPVRAFIRSMERRRLYDGRYVSIFSLMRDGQALANDLRRVRALGHGRLEALDALIDPYMQFVSPGERCSLTGLGLQDIWRYFRHTWANEHLSIPGRSMMFLVRDRAAMNHPVIGIGALCSPVVQIHNRDTWIGWHHETFLAAIRENPTDSVACWLNNVVRQSIADLHTTDFLAEGLLSDETLQTPTEAALKQFLDEGAAQRKLHHQDADRRPHKRGRASPMRAEESYWRARAESPLFRSKRALALAELLKSRMVLARYFSEQPTAEELARLLRDPEGAQAVRRILRKAKSDRVGIVMADISVCGALPPYNALLGGKLVSMLAVGPEVVLAYRQRYAAAESEIASAMAGRPVIRPPHLVLFGTTSLYGIGSSQYNRIKIPCEQLDGRPGDEIRYMCLGQSRAYGTSQYGDETILALNELAYQKTGVQRVNGIFGEGTNPKMRKVREGLELLGASGDKFLRHWRPRVLYCVPLIRNLRDYLLGLDAEPDYLVPIGDGDAATRRIAAWWKSRWLARRIDSDDVLSGVEQHTLDEPITHGARVAIPIKDEAQMALSFQSPTFARS